MKRKILGFVLFSLTLSVLFTSCIEDDYEELGNKGQTFVKILEQRENALFFSPFESVVRVNLFSLRRDVHSKAALNEAKTVTLVAAPELIEEYNEENNANFVWLDEDVFSWAENPSIQETANGLTVTFAPGEFSKEFDIMLNGSAWDAAVTYAVAYKIADTQGLPIADGRGEIIAMISIKNQYDGAYEMTGEMSDVVNPALTGAYPLKVELHTVGPNSVALYDVEVWGDYFHTITSGADYSGYGGFAPVFSMDEEGNVTSVTNFYGQPASNGRSAVLDPTGINKFTVNDDGSKTLEVSYIMVQAGANRTFFKETFTYTGER